MGDDFLAEERAVEERKREPPEPYDPRDRNPKARDGPYGFDVADIDVVPDSLMDFHNLLQEDSVEFLHKFEHDNRQNLKEFTALGADIDGWDPNENYFNALTSLNLLMQDVGLGLAALAGAAFYVNQSYITGDRLAAGEIGAAWDDIDVDSVGMAFGRQERWPAMSENPQEDMAERAERDFAALRAGEGATFDLPGDETTQMGAGQADPALKRAQDRVWDQMEDEIKAANRAEEHPFLDESDSPGWPHEEDYEEWGSPYVTDLPLGHPDREVE